MNIRGTGRTTKQMETAPKGAIFVWLNSDLTCPRNIARKINREDLQIVAVSWITREHLLGRKNKIVVDHAAWLDVKQLAILIESRG